MNQMMIAPATKNESMNGVIGEWEKRPRGSVSPIPPFSGSIRKTKREGKGENTSCSLPLSLFGLGWDFIYFTRILHGFFSATLFASLIGHLYFALFIKTNWPEAKSMVTGRMPLREYLTSHSPLE